MHYCSLIKQWFETILLPGVLILLVSTKKSRLGGKRESQLETQQLLSLDYAYPETIIELKCMYTIFIKPVPGYSGAWFLYCLEG